MSRKNSPSKKDEFNKVQEEVIKETQEINLKNPPVLKDPGGSIANLPVATPEYKAWLENKRKFNSLIGSEYISPAPELGTKMVMLDSSIIEASPDMLDHDRATQAYDPSKDFTEVEDLEGIREDNSDKNVIDFSIVKNMVSKMLASPMSDIERDILEELKKYHEDDLYMPEIDVESCIIMAKTKLLENKNKDQKKLTGD